MKTKIATIPEAAPRKVRARSVMTKADREALTAKQAQEQHDKRNTNKLRLYELLERVARMRAAGISDVSAEFVRQVDEAHLFCGVPLDRSGVRLTYAHYTILDERPINNYIRDLHMDSEDWEFEAIDEQLLFAAQAHERERAAKAAKDAVIRNLSVGDRKILGFENWKDPQVTKC
jgi:hypothetical protein